MKRLLTHDDGRLKTGRVALMIFILIMAGCTIAYKLSKPVDKVMVAVRHVFEAESLRNAAPEKPEEESPVPEPENKPVPQPEAGKKVEESQGPSVKPEIKQQPAATPKAQTEKKIPELTQVQSAPAPGPAKPDSDSAAITNHEPEKQSTAEKIPETRTLQIGKKAKQPVKFTPMPTVSHEKKPAAGELTLASSDYMVVYKSWKEAGKQGGEDNIPLRIENLENVYKLFQMKIVAMVDGVPYVDLSDGSRIAPPSLDVYSSTCFVVSNPFEKFNNELTKAGLDNKKVEVRYYMYDSVRNSIYARAGRAVACCREKGLIASDTPESSVDLLGRSYAIRKKGGGGFGVFVPTRIDLPGGGFATVDPACFKGSRDIDQLISAGFLKLN